MTDMWTRDSVLEWLNASRSEHLEYVDGLMGRRMHNAGNKVMAIEGLNGDPSFAKTYINNLCFRLIAGRGPDDFDRAVLTLMLARVVNNDVALNVACGGGSKPGARKKGQKGLTIAHEVLLQLSEGISVEDAWEKVAEKESISQSLVKQYWIKWKPTLREYYKDALDALPESARLRLL